jgi:hypothetical protein
MLTSHQAETAPRTLDVEFSFELSALCILQVGASWHFVGALDRERLMDAVPLIQIVSRRKVKRCKTSKRELEGKV